ncbi:MAG TPA: glycerophosphodiester phosphodiesterase family protein [Polyangiaceae bacterium]|nr:glycerophosphodiester phosphodiesterase family protein [Polyangiaceae bacterium]
MNTKIFAFALAIGAPFLLSNCEQAMEVSIPSFPDGGLLRIGSALSRDQMRDGFEGFFSVTRGSDLLGDTASVITKPGTVSILTDKNAGFAVMGAACLADQRVVVEGYWQYPTRADAGLVRLFVEPQEVAQAFCNGESPAPTTGFDLVGSYGDGNDIPTKPLQLRWQKELKPWRNRFYTTAHHGACESTDHCGVSPNSIETIRLAERIGSNAVELDVRVTRDGIPILFHDPSFSASLVRGLFCNGPVHDLSFAELRGSCLMRYGEQIPTVDAALTMMVEETELEGAYLDLKTAESVLPTARLVAKLNQELATRTDGRKFGALMGIPTDDVLDAWNSAKATLEAEGLPIPGCLLEYDTDKVIAERCVGWGPTWTKGPQADQVQKLHEHKDEEGNSAPIATIFWTINEREFLEGFLTTAKPDGIITARAALLFHLYQLVGTVPEPRGAQK